MIARILARFRPAKPSPYQVAKAVYGEAHAAYNDALRRRDTRDQARYMHEQSVALRSLLQMEVGR